MQSNIPKRSAWSLWREQRRIARLASARQASWETIRHAQGTASPAPDGGTTRYAAPAGTTHVEEYAHAAGFDPTANARPLPDLIQPARRRLSKREPGRLGLFLYPVMFVLGVVLLLPVGSPLISGQWSLLWVVVGTLLLVLVGVRYPSSWRDAQNRKYRSAGAILAGVLLAATLVGLSTQRVVEGQAQLRGSALDRAVDQLSQARRSLAVLVDNQGLMNLPPEQALPLSATFQAAVDQNVRIGNLWNPATAGAPPITELAEVTRLINLAALTQAGALEAQYANLAAPEPGLAAQALERAALSATIIETQLPAALDAVERAIEKAAGGES